jgi:hypothetical protein
MAVWAARALIGDDEAVTRALRAAHLPAETDEAVRAEWIFAKETA